MATPPAEDLGYAYPVSSPSGTSWAARLRSRVSRSKWIGLRRGLAVLLPVVTAVMASIAAVSEGQVKLYWTVGAITSTLGLALLNVIKEIGAEKAKMALAGAIMRVRIALAEASQPLITNLGRVSVARGNNKRPEIRTLVDRALLVLRAQCGTGTRESYRSSFYELQGDMLVRKAHEGRSGDDPPRERFDADDPVPARRGDAQRAVEIARGERAVVVEDLLDDQQSLISNPAERSYRTVLAAPVNADGRRFGLLCLDSPEPGTLSKIDKHNIMLIAGVVAAGLAQVRQ